MKKLIIKIYLRPVDTDLPHGASRALQSIIKANVVVGESTIQAASFFEGAGRPSKSFWGPQQGQRVILWESLSPEDQEKCLTELQSDRHWVIWCKAKPKDMAAQLFREYGKCIFVEEGGCSRMRCPNKHALLGASRRALQR